LLQGLTTGSERMLDVISSMLDLSRIDNQVLKVLPEAIDLSELFENLKTSLHEPLTERRIQLELAGLETLPRLNADPDLIYKLFYQLVANAIKFTPDGGVITVRGETSRAWDTRQVEIQIIDTGIGVAPENQGLIFEKFFQLTPAKLHSSGKYTFMGGGPGLGLAVAKGIVDAHGGRIWVESPVDDTQTFPGSLFHVLLPAGNE
jgi:signal transduction histidine kinase